MVSILMTEDRMFDFYGDVPCQCFIKLNESEKMLRWKTPKKKEGEGRRERGKERKGKKQ